MSTPKTLIPLEQAPILGGKPSTPDFLANFEVVAGRVPGMIAETIMKPCFVEVKSTRKQPFEFSGNALRRIRESVAGFRLPLLFAVRFIEYDTHPAWAIVEDSGDSDVVRVTFDDVMSGFREEIWNDAVLQLKDDIVITSEYSWSFADRRYQHTQYGYIGALTISDDTRSASLSVGDIGLAATFLRLFGLNTTALDPHRGTNVTQITQRPTRRFTFLVDALYQMNRLSIDESGITLYDPPKILARSDQNSFGNLIGRADIEPIIDSLVDLEFLSRLTYAEFRRSTDEQSEIKQV